MKKALLISDIDHEDCWVCGGLAFPVSDDCVTYEDAMNLVRDKLVSNETRRLLDEQHFLSNYGITEDYKIIDITCYGYLRYIFSNGKETKEYILNVDFITVME